MARYTASREAQSARKMEMHLFQIQRRLCKLQRIAVRTETRLMKYAEKTGVNVY